MDKTMGQDDSQTMSAAAGMVSQQGPATEIKDTAQKYNFSRAGQISDEQMKSIGAVNDFFARNLMHTVGGWLRTNVQVKLVAGEQLPYTEFLDRLVEPTYLCSVRLEPLGALGLIELDLTLASPMVDVLLGGIGTKAPIRPLTDIEEEILKSVVQLIIRELNGAWTSIGLRFEYEQRESAGRAARMMPLGEKTLCVSFELRMPEVQGVLNFCLPAVVLNSILRQLAEDPARARRQSQESQRRMRDLVGATTVGMVLQFAPMKLPARELAALAPGRIVRLPLSRYEMAELCVGGLAMARAHPVRSEEHRGAQIVTLIAEQKRPVTLPTLN